jgi:hypothetical protein
MREDRDVHTRLLCRKHDRWDPQLRSHSHGCHFSQPRQMQYAGAIPLDPSLSPRFSFYVCVCV